MRTKLLILTIAVIAVVSVHDSATGQDNGTTMTANGQVTFAAGTTLLVLSQPKGQVTVQTDGFTIIRKQGQQITVAQISAGDFVNCLGTRIDDHTMKAQQIEVRGKSNK